MLPLFQNVFEFPVSGTITMQQRSFKYFFFLYYTVHICIVLNEEQTIHFYIFLFFFIIIVLTKLIRPLYMQGQLRQLHVYTCSMRKLNYKRRQFRRSFIMQHIANYATVYILKGLKTIMLWFLTVTCSCCPYLYFGLPIMLVAYFSKF